nr:MAG TPA: hypothetical protein [Caudoviricetes sp.]
MKIILYVFTKCEKVVSYTFSHPDLSEIITVDSKGKRGPIKTVYVKRALRAYRYVKGI